MGIPYRLRQDYAEQVADWLMTNMPKDDEASHAVASALMSLANNDGPILLDEEGVERPSLDDMNADVSDVLDHLEAGRTADAITVLKGMADAIREHLSTGEC